MVHGSENEISIGENSIIDGNSILRVEGNENKIRIGKNVYIGNAKFFANDTTKITIGDFCLFSDQIDIQSSDGHLIYREQSATKKQINWAKDIEIGRHVWIGRRVSILKGSCIPDNCVVGTGTMINKVYHQKNSIIVGNPARVVKEGINWRI